MSEWFYDWIDSGKLFGMDILPDDPSGRPGVLNITLYCVKWILVALVIGTLLAINFATMTTHRINTSGMLYYKPNR